jgi:hypothetical protein
MGTWPVRIPRKTEDAPSESVEGISKCYEYHTIFSYLSNTQF